MSANRELSQSSHSIVVDELCKSLGLLLSRLSSDELETLRQSLNDIERLPGNLTQELDRDSPGRRRRLGLRGNACHARPDAHQVPSQMKSDPPVGEIHPEILYTLTAFKKQLGFTEHTVRAARRAGLKVKYLHKQGHILGRDWIDYVTNAKADNRDVGAKV